MCSVVVVVVECDSMVTPRAVDKSESLVDSISDDVVDAAVEFGKMSSASTLTLAALTVKRTSSARGYSSRRDALKAA